MEFNDEQTAIIKIIRIFKHKKNDIKKQQDNPMACLGEELLIESAARLIKYLKLLNIKYLKIIKEKKKDFTIKYIIREY
jgi:hypothetical protein